MDQKAEKIINIEHAENVRIDSSGVSLKKLNKALDILPDLYDCTMAILASIHSSARSLSDDAYYPKIAFFKNKERKGTYETGDIVLSHWQIDNCIGKGSIGSVYVAHHIGHGPKYRSAIKVIKSKLDFSSLEGDDRTCLGPYEFERELDNMVELRGTGYIVDYEDHEMVIFNDGSPGFIIRMELLDPLSDVKVLSRDDTIRLGIDICKALEFCARSNIIHCDVKPSNIYATKWGGYKLGDFSASIKYDNNQMHDRIGTLKYMAPEVFLGKPFSASIDTYSLGLVLYGVLNPGLFSDKEFLSSRLSGKPLPAIPGADKKLQSIILKACSYNPEKRFSSPTEMLEELQKLERVGRRAKRKSKGR